MDFVGDSDGWAAPRLKDADLSLDRWRELYHQMLKIMRRMYQRCRLVHADLSEYNLLYHRGKVLVIDVSQSVEHDHPNALEFLRKDCTNIHDFFKRKGVAVLTIRQLFDFTTVERLEREDSTVVSSSNALPDDETDEYLDAYLDHYQRKIESNPPTATDLADDEVFKHAYIPRKLDEVFNVEREVQRVREEGAEGAIYQQFAGVHVGAPKVSSSMDTVEVVLKDATEDDSTVVVKAVRFEGPCAADEDESDGSVSDGVTSDSNSDTDSDSEFHKRKAPTGMTKEQRAEHKKAVKVAKAEKRKVKMSKSEKKRKEKTTRQKK